MKPAHMSTRCVAVSKVVVALMLVGWLYPVIPVAAQGTPAPTPTIITPATEIPLAAGEQSTLLAITNQRDVTLVGAATPPRISSLDAQNILADGGISWALGGDFPGQTGKPVQITAIYGLATIGQPDNTSNWVSPSGRGPTGGCVNWAGPCNLPVNRCVRGGACSLSSEVIPRFENRPVWIVDLGNAIFYGSVINFNHTVYVVDEETKSYSITWGYNGP